MGGLERTKGGSWSKACLGIWQRPDSIVSISLIFSSQIVHRQSVKLCHSSYSHASLSCEAHTHTSITFGEKASVLGQG